MCVPRTDLEIKGEGKTNRMTKDEMILFWFLSVEIFKNLIQTCEEDKLCTVEVETVEKLKRREKDSRVCITVFVFSPFFFASFTDFIAFCVHFAARHFTGAYSVFINLYVLIFSRRFHLIHTNRKLFFFFNRLHMIVSCWCAFHLLASLSLIYLQPLRKMHWFRIWLCSSVDFFFASHKTLAAHGYFLSLTNRQTSDRVDHWTVDRSIDWHIVTYRER